MCPKASVKLQDRLRDRDYDRGETDRTAVPRMLKAPIIPLTCPPIRPSLVHSNQRGKELALTIYDATSCITGKNAIQHT
jgi:hypothetical protein